jgi:hypothetical protein
MLKPELQNDFSFYRRCITNRAVVAMISEQSLEIPVNTDNADYISMWCRQNMPFLGAFQSINGNINVLHNITNLCAGMILRRDFSAAPSVIIHVLTIMVAAFISYDAMAPEGAFLYTSDIKVSNIILHAISIIRICF